MIRLGACMIAVGAVVAVADHPIPPDPPVLHTNQGRTADDDGQRFDWVPFTFPGIIDQGDRAIWIPQNSTGIGDLVRLTLPEVPMGTPVDRVDIGGSITVTPAPSTLGLLALGGLAMSGRRRRD